VAALLRAHAPSASRRQQQIWVRVNSPGSGELINDLNAVIPAGPDGVVLPKISAASEVTEVSHYLADLESQEGRPYCAIRLLVIATETAQAVLTLGGWAALLKAEQRLTGLTWGMEDLSAAIGASQKQDADGRPTFTFELARSLCLLAASATGVQAVDGVHADFRDSEGLEREAVRARRDGFTGKLAIHPDQISAINCAFTPTPEEIEHARRVVAAFAATAGAGASAAHRAGVVSLDGRMLDRPHLLAAQRVLERAALKPM
jgi:citrate lyase subunit beta/citryl-CoA lyase